MSLIIMDKPLPLKFQAQAEQALQEAMKDPRFEVSTDVAPEYSIEILASCMGGQVDDALHYADATHAKYDGGVGVLGLLLGVAARGVCLEHLETTVETLQHVLLHWENKQPSPFEKGDLLVCVD